MSKNLSQSEWTEFLLTYVKDKPIPVIVLSDEDWSRASDRPVQIPEFTKAWPHEKTKAVPRESICLLVVPGNSKAVAIGIASSPRSISTIDSRIKVRRFRSLDMEPEDMAKFLPAHSVKKYLAGLTPDAIFSLGPLTSVEFIDNLLGYPEARPILAGLVDHLRLPNRFGTNESLQTNAIETALKAFGLSLTTDGARSVYSDDDSSIRKINLLEDAVIEHDARSIPGFELIDSKPTGIATFVKGNEALEVITANKRPLEELFGVDLIYINLTHGNTVMVQYKMLMANGSDWIYRPNEKLEEELDRMRDFIKEFEPVEGEFRLNPKSFYLKFVHRDGRMDGNSIVIPLEHYEILMRSPKAQGPNGGLRVSYDSLGGSFLRETPFIALIGCGYIGAFSLQTKEFRTIIEAVLDEGRGLVVAVQRPIGMVPSDHH